MKATIPLLLLPLALAGASASCAGGEVDAAPTTATAAPPDTALLGAAALRISGIKVEPVRAIPWRDEWTGPGRLALDPGVTQPLGAPVEGRVVRVLVIPGDRVTAGQVLATLHSHEMLDALAARAAAGAALARAENDLGLATSVAARAERLHAAKAASVAEVERARAAVVDGEAIRRAAAAESDRATEMVAHLVGRGPVPAGVESHEVLIRSPMDGVVVARVAQPGEVVVVGAPLLTVSKLSRLQLVLRLPDSAIATVISGAEVRFTVKAYPGREWAARVTRVAPTIDPVTRTLEVLASVSDSSGEMRPEMFATVHVAAPGAAPTLALPAGAVQTLDGDTVVIAATQVGEGLRLRAVPVRIGRRTEMMAEVLSGATEGTGVVVEGAAIARAEIMRRREAGSEE
jgi:cobalt-zinc-cadmium efflux system membrane fusion protein